MLLKTRFMIRWKTPATEDVPEMRRILAASGAQGSDSCASNIFLLREKYNIKTAMENGTLFRLYTGTRLEGRNGMGFPLGGDTGAALEALITDCKEKGKPVRFIYLTQEQKQILSGSCPGMIFDTYDGKFDYMYEARHLAGLEGRRNSKKRNRINLFEREYPDYEIRFFDDKDDGSFLQDMIGVEEKWFERLSERVDSVFVERLEIYEACRYWKELGFTGAVIYVKGEPAAMAIASEISPGIFDINFEKCYGDFARAGGFAVINRYFAQYLIEKHGAKWINREEDIGLEGLRRAKMAYHPDRMLQKYHTRKI